MQLTLKLVKREKKRSKMKFKKSDLMKNKQPLEPKDYLKILAIAGIVVGPLVIGLFIQNMS